MADLTDLEATRLCAEAMGYTVTPHANRKFSPHLMWIANGDNWNPLHDPAQAFALVENLRLNIMILDAIDGHAAGWWRVDSQDGDVTCRHADLKRAIVLCAARAQLARKGK